MTIPEDKTIKILHLEDLRSDAELVERTLRTGKTKFEKLVVDNKTDFEKALNEFSPDIVLSDHSLLNFDSVQALKMVKDSGLNVPFILITATVSEEFAVEVMKQGAYDYILKDRLQRLPNVVFNAIEKNKVETEKQNYHNLMVKSEKHLAEAQRLAKMGSWNYDIKADNLSWSEELYNVFCTNKQTFLETHGSFLHLIDEEDRERALQTSKHTQKTGEPFTIDYHITIPGGEKRIIQEHGYGEKDQDGNVIRLFGTAQDITERVLARKKIVESEERYRQIVETSQEGIWLIDGKNKTFFVNKRFCEIFGYSFEEMMGKTNFDLMDEEEKNVAETKMERRKGGISEDFEMVYVAKSGKRIWVNVSASPIIGDDGNYLGGLAMLTDITERKKSEESLRHSLASLREAQALSHIGNWELDFERNIHTWSDELYSILGVRKEEIIPSTEFFLTCIHPEDLDAIKVKVYEAFDTLKASSYNFRFIRKDGATRYGYMERKFEFDKNDQPKRLFGVVQDITERKLAEEEKEKNELRHCSTK